MDEQLRSDGPAGREFADWVTRGSPLSIAGDDRRFILMEILWDRESMRVRDDEGQDYVIPWKIVRPYPQESDE